MWWNFLPLAISMRWIPALIVYLLIDIYAYQAFRTFSRKKWIAWVYFSFSFLVIAGMVYEMGTLGSSKVLRHPQMYMFGIFLTVTALKVVLVFFLFAEDIFRFFRGAVRKISGKRQKPFMGSRRKFVSTVALGVAAIPFASLIYGMVKGKYNFKVWKYVLEFDDLPEAFDGYTITQLSDIHSGSFDNREMVEYGVNLANEQKSDIIVFTGDLVNNVSDEMLRWKDLFSTLHAPDGVYSVMGNHDYGDYYRWDSEADKARNIQELQDIEREMGWDLLLNEHRFIEKEGQKIAIVGVENWGLHGFKKAGDIDKASEGLTSDDFKIVLSHDPSHWQAQLKEHPKNFQLTLSGHTHGMQFGVEIPGVVKWSPIQYQYKNWAGVYEEFGRLINVNRGFGFLGYPGRVGIWPEITVIKLKKKGDAV